jgi:hypothetical protein
MATHGWRNGPPLAMARMRFGVPSLDHQRKCIPRTFLSSAFKSFVFSSLFAFSSETSIFVAIRELDIVDFERVASLRLSFDLRLEMAVRGLLSVAVKERLPPGSWRVFGLERTNFLAPTSLVAPNALVLVLSKSTLGLSGTSPWRALFPQAPPRRAGPAAIGEAGGSLRAGATLLMSAGLRGSLFVAVIFVPSLRCELPFSQSQPPPGVGEASRGLPCPGPLSRGNLLLAPSKTST